MTREFLFLAKYPSLNDPPSGVLMSKAKEAEIRIVKARPHKMFFIDMITRDISLESCVMDLIDNAVDGATRAPEQETTGRSSGKRTPKPHPLSSGDTRYDGYKIEVEFSKKDFRITDNCGGIPLEIACNYAFNFGRDPASHSIGDTDSGIGIYGIGMKRAVFKLGKGFAINSQTDSNAFVMSVDVAEWAAKDPWDMELTVEKPDRHGPRTEVEVTELNAIVAQEFQSQAFTTRLVQAVARTYAAFLDQGLEIRINKAKVKPTQLSFLGGKAFQPLHERLQQRTFFPESEVDIEIWAGAASVPTADRPGEDEEEDGSMWGWYVLCNNRVVLAAEKSEKTGWGLDKFPQWHPQYNGFLGIVSFRSEEPYALPWTTTKDDIDANSIVFRRARSAMQAAARQYIRYSRARKTNLEGAKTAERDAKPVKPAEVDKPQAMKTPPVKGAADGNVNILYQKPKRQVMKAAAALGRVRTSRIGVAPRVLCHGERWWSPIVAKRSGASALSWNAATRRVRSRCSSEHAQRGGLRGASTAKARVRAGLQAGKSRDEISIPLLRCDGRNSRRGD